MYPFCLEICPTNRRTTWAKSGYFVAHDSFLYTCIYQELDKYMKEEDRLPLNLFHTKSIFKQSINLFFFQKLKVVASLSNVCIL